MTDNKRKYIIICTQNTNVQCLSKEKSSQFHMVPSQCTKFSHFNLESIKVFPLFFFNFVFDGENWEHKIFDVVFLMLYLIEVFFLLVLLCDKKLTNERKNHRKNLCLWVADKMFSFHFPSEREIKENFACYPNCLLIEINFLLGFMCITLLVHICCFIKYIEEK